MTMTMTIALRLSVKRQRGAALLAAMLTVTLVATFASAALWQQFRSLPKNRSSGRIVHDGCLHSFW